MSSDFRRKQFNCDFFREFLDHSVSRGCLTDLETHDIQRLKHDKTVFKRCLSSYCNGEAIYTQCHQASQEINYKSVGYQSRACSNPNDHCFVGIHNDEIIRGCLAEYKKSEDLTNESIANRFDEFYRTCEGLLCNDDVITIEYCFENNLTDSSARRVDPLLKKCPLKRHPVGCYHIEDINDIVLARGCISNLDAIEREQLKSNSSSYKECFLSGCNEKRYLQRCIQGTEDVNRPNASKNGWQYCATSDDKCFVHVWNDVIRRGCLESAQLSFKDGAKIAHDCEIGDFCETCSGSMDCNEKTIETEHCIQCDAQNDAFCANEPHLRMRKQCALAIKPLGCYLSENTDLSIERGCLSNLNNQDRRMCGDNSSDYCKSCYGESCNIRPYFQECFECDMKTNGDNCIGSPTLAFLKRCSSYVGGGCYTMAKRGVFKRGCIDDLTQSGIIVMARPLGLRLYVPATILT